MIDVRDLSARQGGFALTGVTFSVPAGAYGVVIGPAGSGKTTLLEAIAGVLPITGGALHLAGADASTMPPEGRGIGLVYQHGYLFPHLSVGANIAYSAADADVVRDLMTRFGISELERRDVASLSGGERQLVAIARALARRPGILLLDEPFSALDPRRRESTRREVRAVHREWGLTVLQVTHDFAEAGLLGDVAVLLDRGKVLQFGPPHEVFRRPASPYIAEFLGAENVFAGTARVLTEPDPGNGDGKTRTTYDDRHEVEFTTGPLTIHAVGRPAEGRCYAVVRAEEVVLSRELQTSSARNLFAGTVREVATSGAYSRVTLDVDGVPLVAALTARSVHDLGLREGTTAYATFKAMAVHLC